MQKEKWEMYQKKFKDFEATKVVENDQFLVMDWKNQNGSSEFATRYTLDKENGSLIAIDLHGNYTASWCNLLPTGKKVLDYEYFKEKIRGQIEDYRHRNEELIPILKKYNEDPQQSKDIPLNKCILDKMFLLAVGFQMAVDGLSKTSQENKKKHYIFNGVEYRLIPVSKGRPIKLDADTRKLIAEQLDKGVSANKLATDYGISRRTVYRIRQQLITNGQYKKFE